MTLKIRDDFKNLIPPLSAEEFELLEASIKREGCRDPIITWNDTIIDGHNRYAICIKHNIPFKTIEHSFEDDDEAKLWIIENQMARRNLTPYQRSVLALKSKDIIAKKAREKQIKEGKELGGNPTLLPNSAKGSQPINTRETLAKLAGVGHDTIAKVDYIQREAPKEIIAKLEKDEISIHEAYQKVRQIKKVQDVQKKAENIKPSNDVVDIFNTDKKYNIIYADPPWSYEVDYVPDRNVKTHYKIMTLEEILKLPINNIADKNCILFLWVTAPQLQNVFKVIEAWGFKYSTVGFVWVKKNKDGSPFIGLGAWTRANAELCLIAKKGSITCLDHSISQIIETPTEEHSKKPDIVRELIERLVGKLPRIELFARQKPEGWDVWGDEI